MEATHILSIRMPPAVEMEGPHRTEITDFDGRLAGLAGLVDFNKNGMLAGNTGGVNFVCPAQLSPVPRPRIAGR